MSLELYLAFVPASLILILIIVPGPTASLIIANAQRQKSSIRLKNVAGIKAGLALMLTVAFVTFAAPAFALEGTVCASSDGADRAMCVAMIGAERESRGFNQQRAACLPDGDHLAPTYAVMDWIRARPERQKEDLGQLIDEAIAGIDPCTTP